MVHITYYSPAWPPAGVANGIVTYVSVIRDYLLRQGHQVSVLTDGMLHLSDGTTRPLHVPSRHGPFATRLISRLDRRLGHHPFIARRLAAEMRHASKLVATDLIEMEESFGWSGRIQRSLDVPIITRLHGPQCLKPRVPTRSFPPTTRSIASVPRVVRSSARPR
ncbi:glycosyltransferase [Sphingomonas aurantiaca]|uniref:glycosyltransferase n=1 Tax=Sphingomonas aurantiaca TaxID=185949 RepID=UPI002FE1C934